MVAKRPFLVQEKHCFEDQYVDCIRHKTLWYVDRMGSWEIFPHLQFRPVSYKSVSHPIYGMNDRPIYNHIEITGISAFICVLRISHLNVRWKPVTWQSPSENYLSDPLGNFWVLRNCGRVQPSHLVLKLGFYQNFPWYWFPMVFPITTHGTTLQNFNQEAAVSVSGHTWCGLKAFQQAFRRIYPLTQCPGDLSAPNDNI